MGPEAGKVKVAEVMVGQEEVAVGREARILQLTAIGSDSLEQENKAKLMQHVFSASAVCKPYYAHQLAGRQSSR